MEKMSPGLALTPLDNVTGATSVNEATNKTANKRIIVFSTLLN
jgi:hypothetical protein